MPIDKVDEMERNLIFSCIVMMCSYIGATGYYTAVSQTTNLENILLRYSYKIFLLKIVRVPNSEIPTYAIFPFIISNII